jgi:amino-acid N-acetyltransferase
MHTVSIKPRPTLAAAVALLQTAELPVSDLSDTQLEHFFFAGESEQPVGLVGLELYGSVALLRSLVVARRARSHGVGSRLVEHAEAYGRSRGVRSIYILTTTAEAFFAARGYIRLDRKSAPDSIRITHEFASLCPASSAFMVKHLPEAQQ